MGNHFKEASTDVMSDSVFKVFGDVLYLNEAFSSRVHRDIALWVDL